MSNINRRFTPVRLAAAITLASAVAAPTAFAQLEEVIVTAQKRVESLQDVPLSITAVAGDKMEEAGVFKIEDLQTFTPNLSMTETGISTQIYIRGVGTGNNQGFEQSVGQYVDGVHYGRQQLLRAPFLDLERVEVLRGPQGILFGKNSIAGALNIVTAKPTDELEGRVTGKYSPDGEITEFTGILSGPLTDNLFGRISARKYDEDGWMENTTLGNDEPERDEWALRGQLLWAATDNLEITFKAERDEFDVNGRQIEIVQDDPGLADAPLPGFNFSQILGLLGYPGGIEEAKQNNKRQRDESEISENEIENYTLTIDYAMGDYELTSITGFVGYDILNGCDCDFVAAPIIDTLEAEEYDQFSQEIRIVSPGGETVDWLAGVFYQESELNYDGDLTVPTDAILGSPAIAGGALAPLTGTGAKRFYNQDSEAWSVFAQATWNINDTMRLVLGGRYTDETRDADREVFITDLDGNFLENSAAPFLWFAVFGVENQQIPGHQLDGSRDESDFTPAVNFQMDVTENVMMYVSYTEGFKSGGFDARSNSTASWEFEGEENETYELGAKSTLLDGTLEFNAALYYTEYTDLQIAQFDGTLGFNVGNAPETELWGVEIDGRWAITDNLTAAYGAAYLDHEYTDYPNGNCYNRETPNPETGLCDYTGRTGQYAPEWSGFFSLSHVYPLGAELELHSAFDLSYTGEQNVHVNLDPQWEVDDLTQMNFRMGLYADSWDVAVLVQNLSDEQQFTYVGNTPLSGSTFGTNTFYSFMSRPRTTYLQATWHF
ncbi:TonB-dependent receptor [Halioglobus maricola]|uniref:TonB-dependent receptor n=1 Tax=Halioglobus maricola TaxID=2601894 RepID=A0A5P9NNS0_9GAMM|nr:TonB-dependent receptor [Halioglobus maricola]QFU77461.1 TonB-dependent receptor [Halioglobus maricola]